MTRKTAAAKTTAKKTAKKTAGAKASAARSKPANAPAKKAAAKPRNGSGGTAARTPVNGVAPAAPVQRLAPGELRGQVLTFLTTHPKDAFTPVQIQKALDARSAGAVTVALERLVVLGQAKQTTEKPKRWQLVTSKRTKR